MYQITKFQNVNKKYFENSNNINTKSKEIKFGFYNE